MTSLSSEMPKTTVFSYMNEKSPLMKHKPTISNWPYNFITKQVLHLKNKMSQNGLSKVTRKCYNSQDIHVLYTKNS